MKNIKRLISLILIIFIALSLTACNKNSTDQNQRKGNNRLYISENITKENNKKNNKELISVDIIINNNTFSAKLYTSDSTEELINQFPMTINMNEMNGNEKYYYMSSSLTQDEEDIKNIKSGDIMLYGSDCIVIFYKDFETSYKYTRLGYIEDKEKLSDILKNNNEVKITFQSDAKI